ncbi:MAG: hypothetical protein LBL94_01270 [Prevotellaceae bacterium]|jgi:transposase-like protein|nr:hypothetical protein [Prevotellaceae bacterium]
MTVKEEKKMVELRQLVAALQEKVKQAKQQARKQTQKLKKKTEQVEKLKLEKRAVEGELKKKSKVYGILSQTSIERHKYTDLIVSLCVELYTKCHVSFQGLSNMLQLLNTSLKWEMESIPCPNSIENWVKKSGYKVYHSPMEKEAEHGYAAIVDESIMLGSEKMLLTLGIDAEKEKAGALQKKDVSVLNISVASSWSSAEVKAALDKVEKKVGQPPVYVVSDNDSKLSKAMREKGYVHLRDVGHTVALLVEKVYGKSKKLTAYMKALGAVKAKEAMRPASYLLPPTPRSIARFMNLSLFVRWGRKILHIFPRLAQEEKQAFSFLESSRALLNELSSVFKPLNSILKILKTKGLSEKTVATCTAILHTEMATGSKRVKQVRDSVASYLEEERLKLKDDKSCWHASSDIIESMFGYYKFRRSKNRLNGITSYVLLLPLLTRMGEVRKRSKINFKEALESVFMKDLKAWNDDNLTENLAVKRKKKLAA